MVPSRKTELWTKDARSPASPPYRATLGGASGTYGRDPGRGAGQRGGGARPAGPRRDAGRRADRQRLGRERLAEEGGAALVPAERFGADAGDGGAGLRQGAAQDRGVGREPVRGRRVS